MRVGTGPQQQGCRHLLVLDDGLEQGHVQRVLEPLLGSIAPQPAIEWLVDRAREVGHEPGVNAAPAPAEQSTPIGS